ncbi:MAG TPA: sulfite exporter TauE/SafE family protein [Dyadobacter sp.]|nr:sulfite exporter TauE/SafE family protein [Dyadobacter sp.]
MATLQDSLWVYVILFLLGAGAYIVSTLSGGGGSLLLVPSIGFFLGAKAAPPLINLGNLIGEPVRILLFWKDIQWRIVRYYLPSAIIGTVTGAFVFTNLKLEWLQVVIGLFLISTVFQYRFGKKDKSFKMPLKGFVPLGFFVEFFSTLIGATGPVLNPFYLNYGLEKEEMIATKTMNSFLIGLAQISSYAALGALKGKLWLWGLALGLGASAGNWLGKRFLKKLSNEGFRKWAIAMMVLSGIIMIAKQMAEF